MSEIVFQVNESVVRADKQDSNIMLVDYLHEELGLTGTKFCCGIGVCRACTVAVQRTESAPFEVLRSCVTPISTIEGFRVRTIESFSAQGKIHPLQKRFLSDFAFQCGYCTPGFLMAAWVLVERLRRSPLPEAELDEVIGDAIGAHMCRCTGYRRYWRALKAIVVESGGAAS
jgi:aerobic-type carbon monoxide dehydrogenase small subunit (CoxS/CutS family)